MINQQSREWPSEILIRTKTLPEIPVLGPGTLPSFLEEFQPLSLSELGSAALLDRQETKFIFHQDQIRDILPKMKEDYLILEIRGARICEYRTAYYDTAERIFFQQHMRGAGTRWKIRQRTYLDSDLSFLEVKTKDNQKRTRKKRLQLGNSPDWNPPAVKKLISSLLPCPPEDLDAVLEVQYSRSTLVKKDRLERITLDRGLIFSNGNGCWGLPGLMIAEVKQASFSSGSDLFSLLRTQRIQPSPFSKYCVGTILTQPEIKHNRYKPVLREISKITSGGNNEWTH